MKKKILSVFLTVAMILSMATVFAGTVSANDADLVINNYGELEDFIDSLATESYSGKTVLLNANITVNEGWVANDGTANAVVAPTGENAKVLDATEATTAFAGTFDGGNHTISGLYMTHMAFLPNVNGATIKNLTFDNCAAVPKADSSSKVCAGIVVGRLTGGSLALDGVVVKNSKIVNGTTACYVGSLVGRTETTTGTISVNNCKSIACNLYSGANTSLVGGIIGCLNGASGVINITNCSSDTDIVASGSANAGYKCGGIVGSSGGLISIQNCVNTGDIQSQAFAAGMVGDVGTKGVTVTNCVNKGNMTVVATSNKDGAAGGIFGRINNAADTVNGCAIISSLNTGNINVTTTGTSNNIHAGGLVGYAQLKVDRKTVEIENCVNQGEIYAGEYGGGAIGYLNAASATDAGLDKIDISGFVNTGNVTANYKAGGIVGVFNGTSGKIEKVITVGTIVGYNEQTKVNTGASCAMFGQWSKSNGDDELEVIDFFYSNSTSRNVFGLWADLGTEFDNHKASYTATEKAMDFIPGTTNTDDSKDSYTDTQGANLAIYNAFFIENGFAEDPSAFYAENGVNTFRAFNLGKDWMITETVPVPASVFALMERKALEKEDVDYIGFQTNIGADISSIRVIAGLNSIDCENTGFELYIVESGEAALMADKNTTTVYNSLNVYDENGDPKAPYTHASYTYLSAITVTCSADSIADVATLIVKPYITVDDTKIWGDSCAIVIKNVSGTLTVVDQYVL